MAPFSIDPNTNIGSTHLTVADLARSERFYTDVLGFRPLDRTGDTLTLTADGTTPLLALTELPGAPPKPAARNWLVPLRDPDALAARSGALAAAAGRNALPAQRRIRSPGQRGAVPGRPGRQRDRDLPRPPARRVAATGRPDPDGDRPARYRRHPGRAGARRPAVGWPGAGDDDRPYAPARGRSEGGRGVLPRRAGLRYHCALRPQRAVRLGRRLPPPHRPEHLGRRGRATGAGRIGWAAPFHRAAARIRPRSTRCWRACARPISRSRITPMARWCAMRRRMRWCWPRQPEATDRA